MQILSRADPCQVTDFTPPYPTPNIIMYSPYSTNTSVPNYKLADSFVVWADVDNIGMHDITWFISVFTLFRSLQAVLRSRIWIGDPRWFVRTNSSNYRCWKQGKRNLLRAIRCRASTALLVRLFRFRQLRFEFVLLLLSHIYFLQLQLWFLRLVRLLLPHHTRYGHPHSQLTIWSILC